MAEVTPATAADQDGAGDPRVHLRSTTGRAVITAAVLGSALAYMSDDMLNVALPSLSKDLGGGVTAIQWVVNGYFVTMLSLMLVAGSLGDIRGPRRTFLAGLAVFTAGALVAAPAHTVPVLVLGRAAQGVGAALVLACGLALVNRSFRDEERGRAVGVYMGMTAVATAAGPVLGGLLVDLSSWRAIFIVPLVFPLLAAFVTSTSVPDMPRQVTRDIDVKGALLAFVTVSALSFTLIRGPAGWVQADVLVGLAATAVGAAGFIWWQRQAPDPMLPLALFRSATFSGGNAVTLLSFMVSAGAFLFLAVQLQTTLGYRPAATGAALLPLYIIMLVGSPLAGRLADRIGGRIPIVVGNLVLAAGVWWLSFLGGDSTFTHHVLPGVIVVAVGLATLGAPLTSATLRAIGDDDQGIAAGVHTTVGQLAGLLMIVVLPAVAGLSGHNLDGPHFSDGYQLAMRACATICVVAAIIATLTIRPDTGETR